MKKYVVEPATHINTISVPALKEALQALRKIVDDFAKKHPGQIIVGEGAWINTTLSIEAEPAVAEELKILRGIGRVEEPHRIIPEAVDSRKKFGGPKI